MRGCLYSFTLRHLQGDCILWETSMFAVPSPRQIVIYSQLHFNKFLLLTYDHRWASASRPMSLASAFCNLVRYRSIPVPDWVTLLRYRACYGIGNFRYRTGFPYSGTGLVTRHRQFFSFRYQNDQMPEGPASGINCTNVEKETPCASSQLAVCTSNWLWCKEIHCTCIHTSCYTKRYLYPWHPYCRWLKGKHPAYPYTAVPGATVTWARIFRRLWSPEIDSKEWIPPAFM